MKKKNAIGIALICACLLLTESCMTTHTYIGTMKEAPGTPYVHGKGKQLYLFWGLIPLGKTNVSAPSNGICEVMTKKRFGDVIISGITGGILTSYTITVNGKK